MTGHDLVVLHAIVEEPGWTQQERQTLYRYLEHVELVTRFGSQTPPRVVAVQQQLGPDG